MNENKFWGYVLDNNGEDLNQGEFAYGREVLKDGSYDQTLNTPYASFPLFSRTTSGGVQRTTT